MILNDIQITELCKDQKDGMIIPFENKLINKSGDKKIISYGLSSFGYDIRLSNKFYQFQKKDYENNLIIDPKDFVKENHGFEFEVLSESTIINPKSYLLAHSVERFNIPENISVTVLGKSTYARCGLLVNVTPMEAGWNGHLTIELANLTDNPIKLYINEGIAQILFFKGDKCKTSYKDRDGKYNNQKNSVVFPKV